MHKPISLLLTLLAMAPAQAQEIEVEEQPEVRRYAVEVIIFRYAQDVSTGSEIFEADEPVVEAPLLEEGSLLPEAENPLLSMPSEAPIDEPVDALLQDPEPERDIGFMILEEDQYTMGEVMGHIDRLEVYDLLMHFGWIQATWPEEETDAIELASLATPPEGLDGNVTLYLSRYLHLVVNLQLDAPPADTGSTEFDDPMVNYGDYRTLNEIGNYQPPGAVRYRIEEDRIFRSGELRYFDHPKFGVLAKVTRVEEEEPTETQDATETELLGYPGE